MARRRETPRPRLNPSGKKVWQARWTDKDGQRRYGWPPDIAGTYKTKREAQDAIDACYEREAKGPALPSTVGAYAATWTTAHPRGRNTNRTNDSRIRAVLDVKIENVPFKDWPLDMLRRRHANLLRDHLLEDGRARSGVNAVLTVVSSMLEDAIEDEALIQNPFRGMKKVRVSDQRVQKMKRPVRIWSWSEMHEFARVAGTIEKGGAEMAAWRAVYAEPMIRTLADCGLRLAELLALHVADLDRDDAVLNIRRSLSAGEVLEGTKTDRGEQDAGRVVPVPPALLGMLKRMLIAAPPNDSPWLFPRVRGGRWDHSSFYRKLWDPARDALGADVRPHEFRHAYVSQMRAALIDVADLADATGHNVETATKIYTHGLGRSFDAMRKAVGE